MAGISIMCRSFSVIKLVSFFILPCLPLATIAKPIDLKTTWLKEASGEVMLDPQTSGLVPWRNGTLLTIADGSAHESQRLKIISLDPHRSSVTGVKFSIELSQNVASSCFAEYLSDRPDLEALVVDPDDDTVFYTVTEDASRYALSPECQHKYSNSGSTPYPTVLVRMQLQGDKVVMTHARPLRFAKDFNLIDLPNDGIEGMAFGRGRLLYLALEKDGDGDPRIFSVDLDEQWWQTIEFADVSYPALLTPEFDSGNHPINALSYYYDEQQDWLVAAARNDNQLWLIDPNATLATKVIDLRFWTESTDNSCQPTTAMNNYSMEGVAVLGDKVWLVNDPWKVNYMKNVQCASNKARFERMAPLLTWIDLSDILH